MDRPQKGSHSGLLVTTGNRRVSGGIVSLLKSAKIDSPEEENRRKWNIFWDAPLVVPGKNDPRDPPHTEAEIRRASVSYKSDDCRVISNGARVSIRFDGLTLGIFSGDLEFTAYKGSNLLRQEAIASTQEPSVAYNRDAGQRRLKRSRQLILDASTRLLRLSPAALQSLLLAVSRKRPSLRRCMLPMSRLCVIRWLISLQHAVRFF